MFVYDIMLERVAHQKDQVAFQDSTHGVTYKALHDFAIKAGNYLHEKVEHKKNQPIAVFIDRNVESVQAFLAIIYSGNFYVPIDVTQPGARINLILETLKPALIINAGGKEIPDMETPANMIDFKRLSNCKTYDVERIERIQNQLIDTDPLYAMFTSGSTGIPKGVLISYGSVLDMVREFKRAFSFTEESIFGNQAPFDFDVSVKDIYNSLYVGATVIIIPQICFSLPNKLMDFLNDYKVNTGIWATSVLRIIENLKAFKHQVPKYLKQVMFSGEVMPNKVLNYWRQHLPEVEYVNLYGPTEITCNCSFYKVDCPYADDDVLPIGVPFHNTRIIILDEKDRLVTEPSVQGEICVLGCSLALGYYSNDKMTDAAFVRNPLNTAYPERMYRTGDLGYWNEKGLLMYSSRKDHQIKHMGHRIELGEIETAVNALEYIDASVCIYDDKNEKIVLFYESDTADRKMVFKDLLVKMPKYMIPNKMIKLDTLPLNKNRKIDRKLLKKEYIDEVH